MIPRAENKKKIFSPRKAEKLFILYLHCRWLLLSWTEQSGLGECYDWGWPWPLGSWLSLPPSSWPRWHSTPRHPAPHLKMTITVRVWNGYLDLQKISFRINWNKGSMYIAKLYRSENWLDRPPVKVFLSPNPPSQDICWIFSGDWWDVFDNDIDSLIVNSVGVYFTSALYAGGEITILILSRPLTTQLATHTQYRILWPEMQNENVPLIKWECCCSWYGVF